METIKLEEIFFPGQYEFHGNGWAVTAWDNNGSSIDYDVTCHVSKFSGPHIDVTFRGLKDIAEAETVAMFYMSLHQND